MLTIGGNDAADAGSADEEGFGIGPGTLETRLQALVGAALCGAMTLAIAALLSGTA